MRIKKQSLRKDLILLFVVVVTLSLFLVALRQTSYFSELKGFLQEQRVSSSMLDNGELGKIVKKIGVVEVAKNDGEHFATISDDQLKERNRYDVEEVAFQKKRKSSQFLYQPVKEDQWAKLTPFRPQNVQQKGAWPILDIRVPERSLYDPEVGITKHRDKHGKEWERRCVVTFYDKGEVLFATGAGLRIQGGKRRTTKPYWNYKLHFREEYGEQFIPAGLILQNTGNIYNLVVNLTDWPEAHPMNNPLGYDIAKQAGSLAPEIKLFEVYVNGKSQGMSFVVQHYSERQYDQYIENDDYILFKYKDGLFGETERILQRRLWEMVADEESTYLDVETSIDMDNFTRHVFPLAFSGDEDYCQGVAVLDYNDPAAKLHWIQWDMDHSFYDLEATRKKLDRPTWEQMGLAMYYRNRHECDRTWMFSKLVNNYPEFKPYMLETYTEILNHRLTREFLLSRVEYYSKMMADFGDHTDYTEMLKSFMENRPEFIRKEMVGLFSLQGPFDVNIKIPKEHSVTIDGHPYTTSYQGKYFGGQKVTVALENMGAGGQQYWLVNGVKQTSDSLEIDVKSTTDIELIQVVD